MSIPKFYCIYCGECYKYMNDLDEHGGCKACAQNDQPPKSSLMEEIADSMSNNDATDGLIRFTACHLCSSIDLVDDQGWCGECSNLTQEGRDTLNPEYAAVQAALKEQDEMSIPYNINNKKKTIGFAKDIGNTSKPTKAVGDMTDAEWFAYKKQQGWDDKDAKKGKKGKKGKSGGGYVTGAAKGSSGSGATTWSGGKTYTPRVPCDHPGTETLFKIKNRFFAAANQSGVKDAIKSGVKAVIDLAGVAPSKGADFVGQAPSKYMVLQPQIEYEYIRLRWSDMGAPPVGREFWQRIVELLPIGRISINCIGGHGRTGTALASLLIANNMMTASEAIDWVRANHCKRAIESASQEEYLELLQTEKQMKTDKKYLNKTYPGWLAKQIKEKDHHYGWKVWPGYQEEVVVG